MVIAVRELLGALLPAMLDVLTVIVYVLPSSNSVIVYPLKVPATVMVLSSLSEQPAEVLLVQWSTNPVTTEPLGTLPMMVIVVFVVADGVISRTGAGNGTVIEQKQQQNLMSHHNYNTLHQVLIIHHSSCE